jgi:hypothetical protein
MAEEPVSIPVEDDGITLEGIFEEGRIGRSAIVCHPHPFFGGNMENNVVRAAQNTFAGLGWATLRFNFRGTGASGGHPAEGQKDARDLFAVLEFLRTRRPGPVDFAAYSYGAWATMEAIRMGLCPDSLTLISPPLNFMSFDGLVLPDTPAIIVTGDKDEYCSLESLKNWLSNRQHSKLPALEVLEDVDHFYWGAEHKLAAKLGAFLKARILKEKVH